MKPLTIEQLKALPVGDWVWIVTPTNTGEYYLKFYESDEDSFTGGSLHYGFNASYEDYGTKWLAYKNKEQAETKGEIVELPCIREVFKKNKPTYRVFFLRDDNFIDSYAEWTEEEAERRLAELKGEKA